MPRIDRLGIMVSLIVMALLLSILVPLPSRHLYFDVLGSELGIDLTGTLQLAILMVGMICAGTDTLMRTHPDMHDRSLAYTATFWVLPGSVVAASLLLVQTLAWVGLRLVAIGLSGAVLAVVIGAQYLTIDPEDPRARTARLVLNVAVYGIGLFLFVALYASRLRSLISASGAALVGGVLSLELFRIPPNRASRIWLYALLVSLVIGQLAWAMNYVRLDARIGGAFLMVIFYLLSGIVQQYLWRRLTARTLVEFGVIALASMALLSGLARRLLG